MLRVIGLHTRHRLCGQVRVASNVWRAVQDSGSLSEARAAAFKAYQPKGRDTLKSYNAMMTWCGRRGMLKESLELLQEMKAVNLSNCSWGRGFGECHHPFGLLGGVHCLATFYFVAIFLNKKT
eukprot:NODE_1210_length_1233_cov_145.540541_g986_i0.p1 GENE.NODE_1210_length_1233_cov_145.540541_g986_i0~~NODE_1210_length_1233_cov_145.540541_g986_i0.p1  ORF type:complete len:123 (+),score=26.77 NODE_1210_length_1233_cov_145.540541_g986_i0:65-433(+)